MSFTELIINPPLDARAKTSRSRAQNIVIPVNINYIVLI